MTETSFQTTRLQALLERQRAGDGSARDELVRATESRLKQLAHRMLAQFPNVRRWPDTGDVFQGTVLRLLRSLKPLPVANTREFMNLAAAHVRRELLDLAGHFGGPHGWGASHASVGPQDKGDVAPPRGQGPGGGGRRTGAVDSVP
jgi:hypothetical protein